MVLHASWFCLLIGLTRASNLCNESGLPTDSCSDEAASFLQVSTRLTGTALESPSLPSTGNRLTSVKPFQCDKYNKPIHMLKRKDHTGYVAKELLIKTGLHKELYSIPFKRDGFTFKRLNGCGINPKDEIMYCVMLVGNDVFIVRLDETHVEFVARLPYSEWFFPNSGGFSPSGTFFAATPNAAFIVVKDLHKAKSYPGSERTGKKIMDLRKQKLIVSEAFFRCDDIVVADMDLRGRGPEEWLFVLGQAELQIAKYNDTLKTFTDAYKMGTDPYEWGFFYGAGWNFQNQVFFSENKGKGVFQIDMDYLKMVLNLTGPGYLPTVRLPMKSLGKSEATNYNDGMNCMKAPNPWLTNAIPFDCAKYPKPVQALVRKGGYELAFLDYKNGKYTTIYHIPYNRTSPPFKDLNAFGISPLDQVGYATLVMDAWNDDDYPTPPPFYIIRFDSEVIEFIAKVQARAGMPIAGAFDAKGTFYIISNPSLFKFEGLEKQKGFLKHTDPDLPVHYMDSPAVVISHLNGTNQVADIVAVEGNFDKQGNATWVLGVNAYQQLLAVKIDDTRTKHYNIDTNDVIGLKDRQNFGAAWNFDGEIYVSSNDGKGVFQVPVQDIRVPDGPKIKLKKVGASDAVEKNDGLNCFHTTSPFHKSPGRFTSPFTRDVEEVISGGRHS